MLERLDLQHGRDARAERVCVLCGRTVATVQGPSLRSLPSMSLRVQDSQHVAAVRRLRCPYCSGRLWLQNSEEIHVDRCPLTMEELRPRHGRPRKVPRTLFEEKPHSDW
jgi:DNA-directed RNA polymerase subunit RPC12/RpoP